MDLDEIKSRINPAYANVVGTESHERKWLCDQIESHRRQLAECERERDELLTAIETTLKENGHLADGDNFTLIALKRAYANVGDGATDLATNRRLDQ